MIHKCRCAVCRESSNDDGWIWQPFGPEDDSRQGFALPGYHYRGFPALHTCDHCKDRIKAGETVLFEHKGIIFCLAGKEDPRAVRNREPIILENPYD